LVKAAESSDAKKGKHSHSAGVFSRCTKMSPAKKNAKKDLPVAGAAPAEAAAESTKKEKVQDYSDVVDPSKFEKVRLAIGNGLRPEVWCDFQDGFGVTDVLEFYSATEGNGSIFNLCNIEDKQARGKIGRMGAILKKGTGHKLARFDLEREEPVRTADAKSKNFGLLEEAAVGEAGELLIEVKAKDKTTHFKGYTDGKASDKKVIEDAFRKGDRYFRTGDLLVRDAMGFYSFVDRIGDTFRWKGENVSTTEVSEAVGSHALIEEANVYGVKVPGCDDGRGCMAAISLLSNDAHGHGLTPAL